MASTRTSLLRTAVAHVLSALSLAANRLRKFSVLPSPDLLRLRDAALALPYSCASRYSCALRCSREFLRADLMVSSRRCPPSVSLSACPRI